MRSAIRRNRGSTLSRLNLGCKKASLNSLLFLVPLSFILLAWELAVLLQLLDAHAFPRPTLILHSLSSNLLNPEFWGIIAVSFVNLMSGILFALLFAVPLAIATGLQAKFDTTLTPLIMLIGALPDLALLPLFVYWFGPGNFAAVFMATIASFFPIYFTVREGVKDIPREHFDIALIYRTNRKNVYTKIILPAVLPQIVTGMRIAFDFVWEIVLAIELFSRVSGIGSFIKVAVEGGDITDAFAGIFAIGIIAIAVDRLVFQTMEGRVRRWSE